MKYILLLVTVVTTILLSGCGLELRQDDGEVDKYDFGRYYTQSGNVHYDKSLANHEYLEVDSADGSTTMRCSDVLTVRVIAGGVLEIIDMNYDVYLISDDWQLEFYDYTGVESEVEQ